MPTTATESNLKASKQQPTATSKLSTSANEKSDNLAVTNRNKINEASSGKESGLVSRKLLTECYIQQDHFELNNNSNISSNFNQVSPTDHFNRSPSYLISMDSPSSKEDPKSPSRPDTKPKPAQSNLDSSSTTPSYSSIFNPSSHRRQPEPASNQDQQSRNLGRLPPLRKQVAADQDSQEHESTHRAGLFSGKKLIPFGSYAGNNTIRSKSEKDDSEEKEAEEDDEEEDDYDERLPFNSSAVQTSIPANSRSGSLKKSKRQARCCPAAISYNKAHENCLLANQQAILMHHQHNQPKISFQESRPPSFNTCQLNQQHDQWQHQVEMGSACLLRCDCSACIRLRQAAKLAKQRTNDPFENGGYARTKIMHLVLKSIILVLLTILLLMIVVGSLMAAHFLPQAFERAVSASRSFNVTIAGK